MQLVLLLPFIGIVAAALDGPQVWAWKEKGCKGGHEWLILGNDEPDQCSEADWLVNKNAQSMMVFLPDHWTADLYAKNGCPFPNDDSSSKRMSLQKEICLDVDHDKYPSFRLQNTKVAWLYGWSNEHCSGDPVMISPNSTHLDEIVSSPTAFCANDHKPFKAIAFDLPESMAATLYKKDNCEHEMLQIKADDSVHVGNRVCTKNDPEEFPSYRIGGSGK